MNDNKIIKGLECCRDVDTNCNVCPYFADGDTSRYCVSELTHDALELILHQRVQLSQVEQRIKNGVRAAKVTRHCNEQAARNAAIKEFAKRIRAVAFVCQEPMGYAREICTSAVAVSDIKRIEKEMTVEDF